MWTQLRRTGEGQCHGGQQKDKQAVLSNLFRKRLNKASKKKILDM
jgi:hypothetical protein